MKYQHYTVLDFVRDEQFQDWVRNPDERSDFYWHSWMANHHSKKHLVIEAREILLSIRFPTEDASQEIMDDVFEQVIQEEIPTSIQQYEIIESRKSSNTKRTLAVAASIIFFVTLGISFFQLKEGSAVIAETSKLSETIKQNPSGLKTTFHLADGTEIKLNAESTLRIAADFDMETREVYLEGEAYFTVAKNPDKPFIVHTDNVSTLVTGTVFNLNAYPENDDISVAVVEGSVSTILSRTGQQDTLSLVKSEMAFYDKKLNELRKTSYDRLEVLSWKDGIIHFKDAKAIDAFDYLQRWYGVKIHVEHQEALPGSFYGEFSDEVLENVLFSMSKALQFDYHINDKSVTIKPKGMNR